MFAFISSQLPFLDDTIRPSASGPGAWATVNGGTDINRSFSNSLVSTVSLKLPEN